MKEGDEDIEKEGDEKPNKLPKLTKRFVEKTLEWQAYAQLLDTYKTYGDPKQVEQLDKIMKSLEKKYTNSLIKAVEKGNVAKVKEIIKSVKNYGEYAPELSIRDYIDKASRVKGVDKERLLENALEHRDYSDLLEQSKNPKQIKALNKTMESLQKKQTDPYTNSLINAIEQKDIKQAKNIMKSVHNSYGKYAPQLNTEEITKKGKKTLFLLDLAESNEEMSKLLKEGHKWTEKHPPKGSQQNKDKEKERLK